MCASVYTSYSGSLGEAPNVCRRFAGSRDKHRDPNDESTRSKILLVPLLSSSFSLSLPFSLALSDLRVHSLRHRGILATCAMLCPFCLEN